MKDGRKPPFFWAFNYILDDFGPVIGPYGIAVYCALARFASQQRESWPSVQTIADVAGVKKRKAQQTLRHLVQVELVELRPPDPGSRKRTNVYRLIDPPQVAREGAISVNPSGAPDAPLGAHTMRPKGAPDAPGGRMGQPGGGARDAPEQDPGEQDPGSERERTPPPEEGNYPPEDARRAAAALLARLWGHLQTVRRHGRLADPPSEVIDDLYELLRRGLAATFVERALEDPKRDRGEYWSAFRERMKRSLAAFLANRTRGRGRLSEHDTLATVFEDKKLASAFEEARQRLGLGAAAPVQ
jgi:hypothetical protein